MTDDLIDGTLDGWPVSLLIERDAGGKSYGANCAAYTDAEHDHTPYEILDKCESITNACDGLKPAAALRKAKTMGFVPDENNCK